MAAAAAAAAPAPAETVTEAAPAAPKVRSDGLRCPRCPLAFWWLFAWGCRGGGGCARPPPGHHSTSLSPLDVAAAGGANPLPGRWRKPCSYAYSPPRFVCGEPSDHARRRLSLLSHGRMRRRRRLRRGSRAGCCGRPAGGRSPSRSSLAPASQPSSTCRPRSDGGGPSPSPSRTAARPARRCAARTFGGTGPTAALTLRRRRLPHLL